MRFFCGTRASLGLNIHRDLPRAILAALPFVVFFPTSCTANNREHKAPVDHMGRLNKNAQASLNSFLGHFRANFIFPGKLSTQMGDALGGYPFPPKRVDPNIYLVYSFRPHDATNKGAIIITSSGRVLLAALGSFECGLYPRIHFPSSVHVFIKNTKNLRYLPAIKAWASSYCHHYTLHLYSLRCAKSNIVDCPLN